MKLSEILGWEKKEELFTHPFDTFANDGHNAALTSCDREIDREALAKELYLCDYKKHRHGDWDHLLDKSAYLDLAQNIISTMPTWLKRIEK